MVGWSFPQLSEWAGRFGTPLYVYDLEAIRERLHQLRGWLPAPSRLLYSLKANPHPDIVAQVCSLGAGGEVSSPHEAQVALSAGISPRDIVYTGPGKTSWEVDLALELGLDCFSVESVSELSRITARAGKRRLKLLARVHVDGAIGDSGASSAGPTQFGMSADDLLHPAGGITSKDLRRFRGLHFYSATNVLSTESLVDTHARSIAIAQEIAEGFNSTPDLLDLGGGFGAPSGSLEGYPDYEGLRAPLTARLNESFPGWASQRPSVLFESGRYIVTAAGVLILRVQSIKRFGERHYVVVDGGINALGGMAGLGRLPHSPLSVLTKHGGGRAARATVVGPLCTPMDVLGRNVYFPEMPAVDDLIVIPSVGAYGLTASLIAFLRRPIPVELVVDGSDVVGASRLEISRKEMNRTDASAQTTGRRGP